ncbi:MAG: Na+/H+ antiporter NhaC family protein, partial [Lachnospiraceae bacterium]|nr:Na+/H+ antiporter NhaC family protein [Lachnospiraceae bacterium]
MKNKSKKRFCLLPILAVMLLAGTISAFGAEGKAEYIPAVYATFWSLVPPIVAIALALISKEVYSSLFIGILMGAVLYSNFNFETTVIHIFQDGIISVLSDSYNVGILVFLVILGS